MFNDDEEEFNFEAEFEYEDYEDETDDPEYLNHLANLGLNIPFPGSKDLNRKEK